jgi:hypothetical protein
MLSLIVNNIELSLTFKEPYLEEDNDNEAFPDGLLTFF